MGHCEGPTAYRSLTLCSSYLAICITAPCCQFVLCLVFRLHTRISRSQSLLSQLLYVFRDWLHFNIASVVYNLLSSTDHTFLILGVCPCTISVVCFDQLMDTSQAKKRECEIYYQFDRTCVFGSKIEAINDIFDVGFLRKLDLAV